MTVSNVSESKTNPIKIFVEKGIIHYFVLSTQFVTWPFLVILFSIFFKIKVNGRENFDKVKGPFILVANHFAFFDSFLLRLTLGFFSTHLPLRIMAVKKFDLNFLNFFYYIGVVNLIYSVFGVFTVRVGDGLEKNLEQAKFMMDTGSNIVIYPEGQINPLKGIGHLRRGAVVLAQMTSCPLIPITFNVSERVFFRKKIHINIGYPMCIASDVSVEDATEKLYVAMNKQYNLILE